ncbi:hypothetical protein TCAL_16177, partial [Tigriopus californicus]
MVRSFNDSSNHTKCPDPWDDEGTRELLQKFCFWFGGIFFCTIGALGLIGNALSIIVYSSKELRSASFEIDSNRIAGYIFGVVLFSIAYSVPHFFEYKISIDAEGNHEV